MSELTLLAIRPHPDDESSGTGGILARYAQRGVRVGVLTCTLGEEGEINDPDLDPVEAQPRLGQIREQELRAACGILGVSELRLLGYRDSGMAGTPANNHPAAFCNAPLDEAAGRIASVIRDLRPRVIITENERGTYGHPDHVRCHYAAVRGAELAASATYVDSSAPWQVDRLYALEMVTEGAARVRQMLIDEHLDLGWFAEREPSGEGVPRGINSADADAAVDVSAYAGTMRQALAAHRTQIAPDSFLLTWPLRIFTEMFRTAYFRRLLPSTPEPQKHDLLEGLSPRPGEAFSD